MFIPFNFEAPNNGQKDDYCLVLLILKSQTITKKRHQPWSWKPSSKKSNKRPLSRAERKTKNTIIELIVSIVINNRGASKNNNMEYGYDPKILKNYDNVRQWINQRTTENQVTNFEKKYTYLFLTAFITAYVPTNSSVTESIPTHSSITVSVPTDNSVTTYITTKNTVTVYAPTENPVTTSVPTENPINVYVPTNYPVSASVPTDYPVTAPVPTYYPVSESFTTNYTVSLSFTNDYPISDSNDVSINKRGRPKLTTNDNKR